ncbi:MAG: ATP-binding cassette domain-containing protein [Dictyoglomus turgidum]
MNKILEIKNLYHSYNHELILENINLHLLEGEFLGIIGPNGAGKSTLLKIIECDIIRTKKWEVERNEEQNMETPNYSFSYTLHVLSSREKSCSFHISHW